MLASSVRLLLRFWRSGRFYREEFEVGILDNMTGGVSILAVLISWLQDSTYCSAVFLEKLRALDGDLDVVSYLGFPGEAGQRGW